MSGGNPPTSPFGHKLRPRHLDRLMYLVGEVDVQLWDVEARRCAVPAAPLKGPFVSVAAARDAARVLVIDEEQFQVYDLATGARVFGPVVQVANEPPEWGPTGTSGYKVGRGDISPDGKRVVMPGGSYRVLRRYDLDAGTAIDVPLHDGLIYRAAFAADGRRVLTCASDNTARLWDPATGRPVAPPLWHPTFVRDAALAPDGRTAVTYAGGDVRVRDAATEDLLLPPLPHPGSPTSPRAHLSADGRRVVSLYTDGGRSRLVRWVLPEFAAPAGSVGPLVGLFTGRHVDATQGLAPLRDADVRRDRAVYRQAFLAYHTARGPLPPLPGPTMRPPVAPPPRPIGR